MLKSHSVSSLLMCLCLSWTSVASAGNLVEFRPGETFEILKAGRAYQVARTEDDLGFVSEGFPGQKNFDYRSGEFSLDVLGPNVQVAVLSDDGVNVRVTDLGDINEPLGSEPQSLPGLNNLGTGQDLLNLDESLKLIPGSLSANHRYKFEWEYLNTLHVDDSDLDGMKVFVLGGNAQLAAAALPKLTFSPKERGNPRGQWNLSSGMTPRHGINVFPGSRLPVNVLIRDTDSYELNGVIADVQVVKTKLLVNLAVTNATFVETGTATATMELGLLDDVTFYTNQKVTVLVPDPWVGDVTVTCTAVDPGDLAEIAAFKKANAKVYNVQGDVIDDPLTLSVTWKMVPAGSSFPTSIDGISQYFLPFPSTNVPMPVDGPMNPMWTSQVTRKMTVKYTYGPDLNGPNPAANYEGIPAEERFGPLVTNFASKPISLIKQEILDAIHLDIQTGKNKTYPGPVVPKLTFDQYYNVWQYIPASVFTIRSSANNGVDYTIDTYKSEVSDDLATKFLKAAPTTGDVFRVTLVQTYFCNNLQLTGDTPTQVISTYTAIDDDGGATKEQQVTP